MKIYKLMTGCISRIGFSSNPLTNHRFINQLDAQKGEQEAARRQTEAEKQKKEIADKVKAGEKPADVADGLAKTTERKGDLEIGRAESAMASLDKHREKANDPKLNVDVSKLKPEELLKVARANPEKIFGSSPELKNRPEYRKTLTEARDAAVKNNPSALLAFNHLFKELPDSGPSFRKAIENVKNTDPRAAMEYAALLLPKADAKKIFALTASKDPYAARRLPQFA